MRTANRNALIADLYRSGATMEEVGSAVGLSRERVRQILSDLQVTSRPSKSPRPETLAAVRAILLGDGAVSISDAARTHGLHVQNLSQYLRRHHPDFDYSAKRRVATADIRAHGTRNRYANHGCRCDECRAANAEATVVVPVDVFETMRTQVDSVRDWAIAILREAAAR